MKLVMLGQPGFIGEAIFEHFQGSGTYEVSGFDSSELNLAVLETGGRFGQDTR
jgi:dTDP-4-dehydrorhamnose reductase